MAVGLDRIVPNVEFMTANGTPVSAIIAVIVIIVSIISAYGSGAFGVS